MRFIFYTHSLVSDWNHGNAHFQRGVARELVRLGHAALALEPADGWSRKHLIAEGGEDAVERFSRDFPTLCARTYDHRFPHEAWLDRADVVIVHEWTDPALVARIGRARRAGRRFTLLFHDTHHRAVSAQGDIARLDLEDYDGILVFGEALRERYERQGWGRNVHVWHEAADEALFRPMPEVDRSGDLVWIGNWGDGERTAELDEYLIEPVRRLGLNGTVHGVRYPEAALRQLREAGLSYGGRIANFDVPVTFARHRVTVHIPRRPYVEALPGIPTIRMFEALACGIPLVSAPWNDAEHLFRAGTDFLFAHSGKEMAERLRDVLNTPELAASLAASGLETIRRRHTCRHRVEELIAILGRHRKGKSAWEHAVREAAQ